MAHPNTMIGRLAPDDPALVRCVECNRIAVSCDADRDRADRDCCDDCTHEPRP